MLKRRLGVKAAQNGAIHAFLRDKIAPSVDGKAWFT
jgi:hypothetical protein